MLLQTIFYVAMAAEAMTAALAAGRRKMDWFGVCVLACVTALGGGTMR
ncbi:MAG: TRIC cation channel family protein, partial [Devosia sp.]|nr:TRIC cation channel family protein [Devosia sp.]